MNTKPQYHIHTGCLAPAVGAGCLILAILVVGGGCVLSCIGSSLPAHSHPSTDDAPSYSTSQSLQAPGPTGPDAPIRTFASYGDIPAAVERRGLNPTDVAPPYPAGLPSQAPSDDYPSFDPIGHSTHSRKASTRSNR